MKAKGIFIPLNTPSSKNSKRIVSGIRKDGVKFNRIIHSKTVLKYIKESKVSWLEQKAPFRYLSRGGSMPQVIGVHFVRGTRHKYDWINMVQIVQDLMVEYEWIKDDDTTNLIPVPFKIRGEYSTYSKDNPGVWIVPITKEMLHELKGNINE